MLRISKRLAELRQRRKFVLTVTPFVAVFLAFANTVTLRSSIIGLAVLIIYMVANGDVLGRAFFEHERPFFRLIFGLFAFIVILALAGIAAVFVVMNESWYLFGMVFAAGFTFFSSLFFARYESARLKEDEKNRDRKFTFNVTYVCYVTYATLLAWSFLILLSVRSGWVRGPIWEVVPSIFLPVYFAATAVLVATVLLGNEVHNQLALIVLHSLFSLSFIFIVSYPGIIFYDPWYDLGRARTLQPVASLVRQLFPTGSMTPFWVSEGALSFIRVLNMFLRGVTEHSLIATFAGILNIDMFWSYLLLLPVLWGLFVPVTSYRIAEMIGLGRKTSVLAAVLTIPNLQFLAWGKLTEATSMGVLFFVFTLYMLILVLSLGTSRRIYLMILLTLFALLATHFVPALVAFSLLVLVFAFREYDRVRLKSSVLGYFTLLASFLIFLFALPSLVIFRGVLLPMIGTSAFSIENLLNTSIWAFVSGISENLPVYDAALYEIYPLLGLLGLIYTLRSKTKLNKRLCLFFFLALLASLIQFRV
ncbi:hypothetical protein GTO27_01725, partial [Candidatus Bathyarchaeota archaeon]|nr:hypothetical protein [Candidatus Bathyarchaeota archaeon]